MKSYRRYIRLLLAVILVESLLFLLFNVVVDPYGVINSPVISRVNRLKPEINNHVMLYKAVAVTRIKPKVIFLGSSRTEFGLDPKHPVFANSTSTYNLALTGANIYPAMRYFKHAIANQPNLQQVVIGIDLFMFSNLSEIPSDFSEARLDRETIVPLDAVNVIFSLDAFQASRDTIDINKKDSKSIGYFYPDGRRDERYYVKHVYENKPTPVIFKEVINKNHFRAPEEDKNYQVSNSLLSNFKTIVTICQQRNIDLKILISPSHATEWEALRVRGLWPIFEQWKREIVKIVPVWDFSGYNSITTEAIGNNMKNYIDNSHYRKEVGDLVLNRIFNYNEESVPADFGVLLTPENIESHLAKIRDDREIWAKNNPDVVQFVLNLKPSSK
ncbi:hypothetical protein [Argonema galeatum]|uniref:hypothetical protein n=1 Tax=Argonema galeatum TaxID=2942762 RepID=UPI00201295E2|nr:hypothetical protein [Argonema galeatum]MCL1464463.1 hypothetical protein [Argonema galeatum A003/A1]